MTNLTGRIPDKQDILEGLACRIAASSARFVLLLENHTAQFGIELLTNQKACSIVMDAGFHEFCSEMDSWQIMHVKRMLEHERQRMLRASTTHDEQAIKQMYDNGLIFDICTGAKKSYLKLHLVGDTQTTTQEVLTETRRRLNKSSLLVEDTFVEFMKKTVPGVPTLFFFGRILAAVAEAVVDSHVVPIVNAILEQEGPIARKLLKRYGNREAIDIELAKELTLLDELLHYYRVYGMTDTRASANILNKVKERAIINFGANHGMVANNLASLPDQLIKQAKIKGQEVSFDIIRVMDRNHVLAEQQHWLGVDFDLRASVAVYDVELQREWPIREWIKEAPQIYGWTLVPPARPGQVLQS